MIILICNEMYYPNIWGGAEKSVQLLAESLVAMGNCVYVYTSSDHDYDDIVNGVNVLYRKVNNIYWAFKKKDASIFQKLIWHTVDIYNLGVYCQLTKIIKRIKPDIIHTNNLSSFSVSIWKAGIRKNIPVVHTLRDYYLVCVKSSMFKNGVNCDNPCALCIGFCCIKKLLSRNLTGVVGISHYILSKHLDLGYFSKVPNICVIPNSVNVSQINIHTKREKLIGYMGRIHESKGVERLIKDFLELDSADFYLAIAGTGDSSYVEYLKVKYSSSKIIWMGFQDTNLFMRRISLLVVPSLWHEPFGRTIIEALANGCPVIASNRGGIPEIIPKGSGAVFDLDNQKSLKILLSKFIHGEISFNVNSGDFLSSYSQYNIASRYVDFYKKAINSL